MRKSAWLLIGVVTCLGAFAVAEHGKPVTRRGTSVLHYTVRNDLVSTEAGSNTLGSLRLQFNEQGHSQKQSLRLTVAGLETNATYQLIAIIGDDTNALTADTLVTDGKGRARAYYLSKAQGNGGKNPLPDELSPLTDIRAIGLENASTQTVAYTHIADATKFQYLVKRNLTPEDSNGPAAGSISLIANQRRVHFRLLAGGLSQTNDYYLALNSNILNTVSADEDGRLQIKVWPNNAPPVLEIHSLSLLDSASNTVLSTRLPR